MVNKNCVMQVDSDDINIDPNHRFLDIVTSDSELLLHARDNPYFMLRWLWH